MLTPLQLVDWIVAHPYITMFFAICSAYIVVKWNEVTNIVKQHEAGLRWTTSYYICCWWDHVEFERDLNEMILNGWERDGEFLVDSFVTVSGEKCTRYCQLLKKREQVQVEEAKDDE